MNIRVKIPQISKQIYYQETFNVFINKYSKIGPQWTKHQMEWLNGIYKSFKDHDKFLIIIHLIKKTLDFYSRNFTKLSFEEFYLRDTVEIEKFNISDISKQLNIPKETTRRKVRELENSLVIKKNKETIVMDRSTFPSVKPIQSVIKISRFLSSLSKILSNEKILPKPLSTTKLEKIIQDNFSYVWKLYYEVQIPMLLNYKKAFSDIETFHIFGTCVVNQHLYAQKKNTKVKTKSEFIKSVYKSNNMPGLNAMSISDITGIPRATVVRKLKKLTKSKHLSINNKKHYKLTGNFVKKLIPLQEVILSKLSTFSTKVFNLAIL